MIADHRVARLPRHGHRSRVGGRARRCGTIGGGSVHDRPRSTPMSKRARKRRARKNSGANHGNRPNS
jgi:hypothetical protein